MWDAASCLRAFVPRPGSRVETKPSAEARGLHATEPGQRKGGAATGPWRRARPSDPADTDCPASVVGV